MIDWICFTTIQFVQFIVVVYKCNEMMIDRLIGVSICLAFNSQLLVGLGERCITLKQFSTFFWCQIACSFQKFLRDTALVEFNAMRNAFELNCYARLWISLFYFRCKTYSGLLAMPWTNAIAPQALWMYWRMWKRPLGTFGGFA